MLVIAALQENQGQPIKASHIVTDVYIKKAIKEEVMSDPVNCELMGRLVMHRR